MSLLWSVHPATQPPQHIHTQHTTRTHHSPQQMCWVINTLHANAGEQPAAESFLRSDPYAVSATEGRGGPLEPLPEESLNGVYVCGSLGAEGPNKGIPVSCQSSILRSNGIRHCREVVGASHPNMYPCHVSPFLMIHSFFKNSYTIYVKQVLTFPGQLSGLLASPSATMSPSVVLSSSADEKGSGLPVGWCCFPLAFSFSLSLYDLPPPPPPAPLLYLVN